MITVEVQDNALTELKAAIDGMGRGLSRELATAVNKAATKTQTAVSREVRTRLVIKAKDLKANLRKLRATKTNPSATVSLFRTDRIPLKRFGARQIKKGVSYKIDKIEGRKVALGAFGPNIPRLGHHAFKRTGKARKPIVKLHGPSAYGVFLIHDMDTRVSHTATAILDKEIRERVRFLLLKKFGRI